MTHLKTSPEGVEIYGENGPFCSACAPDTMKPEEVERTVNAILAPELGTYRLLDIGDLRPGPRSPLPCNTETGRRHWFLCNHEELCREFDRSDPPLDDRP